MSQSTKVHPGLKIDTKPEGALDDEKDGDSPTFGS